MLHTIFNILLIILGFGVLIFIHELGHFIAAKWAGIRTEAFAVGMGPVAVAWRKGIGLRFRSTAPEYEARVRERLAGTAIAKSPSAPGDDAQAQAAELPRADFYRIGDQLGLGETEYSLRWLPIGGFVKMLGQEDANPKATSDDPRSYNMRPIGKRMVVVSAGVIMNLILAIVLFVIAFVIGVRFPAPVVGDVSTSLPAARVMPMNAQQLTVQHRGLRAGDRVLSIDGEPARTFADVQIASAMSRPGQSLSFTVKRRGIDQPLQFEFIPEKDPASGLLSLGITPGASTTLINDQSEAMTGILHELGLAQKGVEPGMSLVSVNGTDVMSFGEIVAAADESGGRALATRWAHIDEQGERRDEVGATVSVLPELETYLQTEGSGDQGLLGLSPLVRFVRAAPGSPNADIVQPGDVLIKLADHQYPRRSQLFDVLKEHKGRTIEIVVLRDGREAPLTATVRKGKLGIEIAAADDLMITAVPVAHHARYRVDRPSETEARTTPAGESKGLTGGTRIFEVAGTPVADWKEFREAVRIALDRVDSNASGRESAFDLEMLVEPPGAGSTPAPTAVTLALRDEDIAAVKALGWTPRLSSGIFEPLYTVRKGRPLQAIAMGFEETRKMIVMTYLTFDRLIRGSVGVDQLRGPVGIVHIGTKVANEGFTYLLFFLGMISVNLAVINFLPMPIVDGGLFLFLVYEKIKGRPPPLAFQNAATIVGLAIICAAFLVTFYNDVLRLFT